MGCAEYWHSPQLLKKIEEGEHLKAVVIEEFGNVDVLKVKSIDKPMPSDEEVLIKVISTSVNFADIKTRVGKYHAAGSPPIIVGLEALGIVVAIGDKVQDTKIGDYVIAFPKKGSYAQYVIADSMLTYTIPDQHYMKFHGAPLVAFTAYYLIKKVAQFEKNESIVIHGAAGGVGTTAIQIAKYLGAKQIIGTVSRQSKVKAALDAGADYVVVTTEENTTEKILDYTNGQGVDIILDSIAGETSENSFAYLKKYGRLVIFGDSSGAPAQISSHLLHSSCRSVLGYSIGTMRNDRPHLLKAISQDVISLITDNHVKIHIGAEFQLEQAAKAHELMESRDTLGKIIIHVT